MNFGNLKLNKKYLKASSEDLEQSKKTMYFKIIMILGLMTTEINALRLEDPSKMELPNLEAYRNFDQTLDDANNNISQVLLGMTLNHTTIISSTCLVQPDDSIIKNLFEININVLTRVHLNELYENYLQDNFKDMSGMNTNTLKVLKAKEDNIEHIITNMDWLSTFISAYNCSIPDTLIYPRSMKASFNDIHGILNQTMTFESRLQNKTKLFSEDDIKNLIKVAVKKVMTDPESSTWAWSQNDTKTLMSKYFDPNITRNNINLFFNQVRSGLNATQEDYQSWKESGFNFIMETYTNYSNWIQKESYSMDLMKNNSDIYKLYQIWDSHLQMNQDTLDKRMKNLGIFDPEQVIDPILKNEYKYVKTAIQRAQTQEYVMKMGRTTMIQQPGQGPSQTRQILAVVFNGLANTGSTITIGGASAGPAAQGLGIGVMAVGSIGNMILTAYDILEAKESTRDLKSEFWQSYKEFVNSPDNGVRRCMGGSQEAEYVKLGYRSQMDKIGGTESGTWTDSLDNHLIVQWSPLEQFNTRLYVECFSGSLRMMEGDIQAFSTLVLQKDQRRIWSLNTGGLALYWNDLSFTCGKEIMLRMTFDKVPIRKVFVPSAFPGDQSNELQALSSICETNPLKKIQYTTSGCKYNSRAITHTTSCGQMYEASQWDSKINKFILVSGIFTEDQNQVKMFSFKNNHTNFTLDTRLPKTHSKCMFKNGNTRTCYWPDPIVSRDYTENKTREFEILMDSYDEYESSYRQKSKLSSVAFGLMCEKDSDLMTLDKKGTFDILKISNGEYKLYSKQVNNWIKVQCRSKDNRVSDTFLVKTVDDVDYYAGYTSPSSNIDFESSGSFRLSSKEVLEINQVKHRQYYPYRIEVSGHLDINPEAYQLLRSGNYTWQRLVFSVRLCKTSFHKKTAKQYDRYHTVCDNPLLFDWNDGAQVNTLYGQLVDRLDFKYVKSGSTNKYVKNPDKDCKAWIDLQTGKSHFKCVENSWKYSTLEESSHINIDVNSNGFFCSQQTQSRECSLATFPDGNMGYNLKSDILNKNYIKIAQYMVDYGRGTRQIHGLRDDEKTNILRMFDPGYDGDFRYMLKDMKSTGRIIVNYLNGNNFNFREITMNPMNLNDAWCCGKEGLDTSQRPIEIRPLRSNKLIEIILLNSSLPRHDNFSLDGNSYTTLLELYEMADEIQNKPMGLNKIAKFYKDNGIDTIATIGQVMEDYYNVEQKRGIEHQRLMEKVWDLWVDLMSQALQENLYVRLLKEDFMCCAVDFNMNLYDLLNTTTANYTCQNQFLSTKNGYCSSQGCLSPGNPQCFYIRDQPIDALKYMEYTQIFNKLNKLNQAKDIIQVLVRHTRNVPGMDPENNDHTIIIHTNSNDNTMSGLGLGFGLLGFCMSLTILIVIVMIVIKHMKKNRLRCFKKQTPTKYTDLLTTKSLISNENLSELPPVFRDKVYTPTTTQEV